jgi:hypothetical protein
VIPVSLQVWQMVAATIGAWAGLFGAFGVGFTVGRSRGKQEAYADVRQAGRKRKKHR